MLQVVEDFSLLHFMPMAIEDKDSVQAVVAALDKATGYVFKGLQDYHPHPELAYAASSVPVPQLQVQPQHSNAAEQGFAMPDSIREH